MRTEAARIRRRVAMGRPENWTRRDGPSAAIRATLGQHRKHPVHGFQKF